MTFDADTVRLALEAKAEDLRDALFTRVAENLSGEVLRERSGALKASITADLDVADDAIAISLASTGVAYAAIQEYGGTTPPHTIVPVKARALALAGGGVFARVRHPGSRIPARPYLGSARESLHDEIVFGLKDAITTALGVD